jgi:uncharacterized protein YdaU (DUF1376 family)
VKFYKRFPGDITIKTGGLTLAEFGAYDRLLDHYYATEQPIAPAEVYSIARCQTAAERRAVDAVLARFWSQTGDGWIQQRADEMIAEAQPKIEAARQNGKKGGRPSKATLAALAAIQEPTGLFSETQREPNAKTSQSQNRNGSEAKASAAGAAVGEDEEQPKSPADMTKTELWRAGKSLLREQGMPRDQCGSFVGALVKQYGDAVVVEAVRAAVIAAPADAREYLKATCMRKTGERADASPPGYADMTAKLDAESTREKASPDQVKAAMERVKAIRIAAMQGEGGNG